METWINAIGIIAAIITITIMISNICKWILRRRYGESDKSEDVVSDRACDFIDVCESKIKELNGCDANKAKEDFIRFYNNILIKNDDIKRSVLLHDLGAVNFKNLSNKSYNIEIEDLKKLLKTLEDSGQRKWTKTTKTQIDELAKYIIFPKKEEHLYQEPPRIIINTARFLPKELRDQFKDEIIDYVRDGIAERIQNKRSKKLFIISETWKLVLLVGKWKLFGFMLRRRKSIQPPS